MSQTPNFTVQPETRALTITKDHTAEIRFLVASRVALRGEAHIIPVAVNGNRDLLTTVQFLPWLTLVGEREIAFDPAGEAKPYTVRITVPDDADPGTYTFRLKVVDVAEPDETVGESPEITFQVVGPKPSVAGFVAAAVLALLILSALAVWAVVIVQNQTNLQITITRVGETVPPDTPLPMGEPITYAVKVENRRSSPVDGVRLRYVLPPGVIGAYAAVDGAITRYCDKLNRERIILCDLGTLDTESVKTLHFVLIPNPNGWAGLDEVTEILEGETGFVGWLRSFFTSAEEIVERKLVGTVENTFQVSGYRISTREVPVAFTVERCLAYEVQRDGELLQQRTCPHQGVWVSLDPAVTEATLNEIQPYTIRVWNEHTDQTAGVVVRYELPERLRYLGDKWPPPLDPACTVEQYFTVACKLTLAPATQDANHSVDLQELPLQFSSTSAGALQNTVVVTGILTSTLTITDTAGLTATQIITTPMAPVTNQATTTNMNTALRFDGIDDWVDLGLVAAPLTEFSVEMWLHPFSYENGQSFIGVHTNDGQNLFLVGYWPDEDGKEGLLVNVLGDDRVMVPIDEIKQEFPQDYHLTVTVKALPGSNQYDVTVYLYNKETDQTRIVGPYQFTAQLDVANFQGRSWVLGQDWDQGSPAPRPSDFFKGTMREVRLWRKALDETQVRCVRTHRFYIDPRDGALDQAQDFGADCVTFSMQANADERPRLAGYWRLDGPLDQETAVKVANLAYSPTGEALTAAELHGGANWGGIDPRFGSGLLFDGINDYVAGVTSSGIISLTASPLLSGTGTIPEIVPISTLNAPTTDTLSIPVTSTVLSQAFPEIVPIPTPIAAPTTDTLPTTVTSTVPSQAVMASLATWVYVADGIPTERQWVAGVVGEAVSMGLMLNENGQMVIVAGCGQMVVQLPDSKTIPINRWVHYTGVMSLTCDNLANATLFLYRDGTLAVSQQNLEPTATPPWADCPANVYLGGLGAGPTNTSATEGEKRCRTAWSFKGRLDEVRIWNRVLSYKEVPRWRNRAGEHYDELAYWPFAEGSGNISYNAANNDTTHRYQLQVVGPNWIDTNFDLAGQDAGP